VGPSRPISLFSNQPTTNQRPYSFVVSIVLHVMFAGLILYGFLFAPRINMRDAAERYTLRQVDLTSSDQERKRYAEDSKLYPGQRSTAHTSASHDSEAAPSASPLQAPKLKLSDRTIVQPDIPDTPVVLKHTPLPSLLLWAAQTPKVKLIAPPPVPKMANVNAKPTLVRPTPQENLTDVPISSTPFNTKIPLPQTGSSTPVQVQGPDLAQRIPQTSSEISTESASGAVISISETHLAQGTIAVPAVNQTAPGNANGALGTGKAGASLQNGAGDPTSRGTANGASQSKGTTGTSAGPAGNQRGTNPGGAGNTGVASSGTNGQGNEPSFTRVSLPPNGQYGVVVVGSSAMADQYPETAALWGGRLIYSVYLKVGLAKSWILQYSLPSSADAATSTNVDHLDAPWPFYVVRPTDGPANVNADALMIHGFIDAAGHFDGLTVEFPPGFRHAQLLLQALQQWKFRPAKHNGQVARVEILLIIPENED
jgi:hypothetical protein